jgi:rhodanese-related sulfurtransferase
MPRNQRARRKKSKQNRQIIIIAVLVLAAVLIGSVGFLNAQPTAEVTVQEAFQRRAQGAFILDVREPYEWNENHIPGAYLIPLGELAGRIDELPKDQEIVVVCRSGNRSQTGRDILLDAGLANVTSMAGGVNQWIAAGYEVVSGP